nr:MAG TPA: hypothetical protein [Bacteriophage sp.]
MKKVFFDKILVLCHKRTFFIGTSCRHFFMTIAGIFISDIVCKNHFRFFFIINTNSCFSTTRTNESRMGTFGMDFFKSFQAFINGSYCFPYFFNFIKNFKHIILPTL